MNIPNKALEAKHLELFEKRHLSNEELSIINIQHHKTSLSQERDHNQSQESSNESSVAKTIVSKGRKAVGTGRQFQSSNLKSRNMGVKKIALHQTQKPVRTSTQDKLIPSSNLSNHVEDIQSIQSLEKSRNFSNNSGE